MFSGVVSHLWYFSFGRLAGRLFSWGIGSNNQLGLGDEEDKFEPQVVSGRLADKCTLVVSGGGQHTVILVGPAV